MMKAKVEFSSDERTLHPEEKTAELQMLGRVRGSSANMSYDLLLLGKFSQPINEAMGEEMGWSLSQLTDKLLRLSESTWPESLEWKKNWTARLLTCFHDAGMVNVGLKEVENEYDKERSSWRPWFRVYTPFGVFKVGWRKSVINLDWTDTLIEEEANTLFPNEDTTKGGHMIHAHGYEKLTNYLTALRGFREAR